MEISNQIDSVIGMFEFAGDLGSQEGWNYVVCPKDL